MMNMTENNNFNLITSTLDTLFTVVDTLEAHASSDKTRSTLCTIACTAKGEWVATNGHTLALLEVEPSQHWSPWTGPAERVVLLPAKPLRQALLSCRKAVFVKLQKTIPAVIRIEEGRRWTLTVGGITHTGDCVEGTFPAWRQVWPQAAETPPPYEKTGWGTEVLARVVEAGSRFGDNLVFEMEWHGVISPAVLKTKTWLGESRATLTILAMPARI